MAGFGLNSSDAGGISPWLDVLFLNFYKDAWESARPFMYADYDFFIFPANERIYYITNCTA